MPGSFYERSESLKPSPGPEKHPKSFNSLIFNPLTNLSNLIDILIFFLFPFPFGAFFPIPSVHQSITGNSPSTYIANITATRTVGKDATSGLLFRSDGEK